MASPVTIQPATADTFINEGSSHGTAGSNAHLYCQKVMGGEIYTAQVPILTFDFSAEVPTGATITSAILSLYCSWTEGSGDTMTVYRLIRPYIAAEACWAHPTTTIETNWGTDGAQNTTTDTTETDKVAALHPTASSWQTWDVTNQVQTALDDVSGVAHFLIRTTGGATQYTNEYSSSDHGDATTPKLYIEYTEAASPTSYLNIGDTFKAINFADSKLNIGDAWKAIRTVKVNIGDVWKRVYSSPAVLNQDATYILLESGTDDRIEVE